MALLRLQCIPQIGNLTAKKLVAYCGSASGVFQEKRKHLLLIEGIGSRTLRHLWDTTYARLAEAELSFIRDNSINFDYFEGASYPKSLKHCPDGPILLFSRGNIRMENSRIISVVGTRNCTPYGNLFSESFIEEIAPLNPIIVSGYAYGIDIKIHRAAIKWGLQTIACLAHGLNQIYPRIHRKYQNEMEQNGGFITEFWSSSKPDRENFLKRNRIIAGISEATLVVESAEKGGSLVTADLAQDYNREVFAVPGRIGDKFSEGCNNLIKQQKAHLITSAADLIYLLGWEIENEVGRSVQKSLFVELNNTEQVIFDHLKKKGIQLIDDIALNCEIPIIKLTSTLFDMEMKGVVRPLPGKRFELL